jgi:hypothetical protein
LGLLDEDTAGKEQGVFEEASFDGLLLLVLVKQSLGWVGLGIKNIGCENEAAVALAVGLFKLGLAFQDGLGVDNPERGHR